MRCQLRNWHYVRSRNNTHKPSTILQCCIGIFAINSLTRLICIWVQKPVDLLQIFNKASIQVINKYLFTSQSKLKWKQSVRTLYWKKNCLTLRVIATCVVWVRFLVSATLFVVYRDFYKYKHSRTVIFNHGAAKMS